MSLYQDRGGVLWVGTRAGGASHWNPRSWALGHYRARSTRNVAVNAFAEDGAGTLWVGTLRGLVEIDTSSRRERRHGLRRQASLRLAGRARDGASARSQRRALDRHDGRRARAGSIPTRRRCASYRHAEGDPASLPADGVMSLYEDRQRRRCGSARSAAASRAIDPASGALRALSLRSRGFDGLSIAHASAIAEDSPRQSVDRHDRRRPEPARSSHRSLPSLPSSRSATRAASVTTPSMRCTSIGDGELWVGTAGGGVDHVIGSSDRPGRPCASRAQSGLADMRGQVVYGIESDGVGRLWLSTNNGLVRFDPRTRAMKVFHEAHGLQGEDFNFNAHFRGARRHAVLRRQQRLQRVRAGRGAGSRAAAARGADLGREFSIARSRRTICPAPGRPLQLAHNDKLVTFAFSALDFTSPENNRYRYRLEGFDAGWNNAGGQRSATYTNLDAGKYVFRVRAANADGVWNEDGLAIPVHVAAAPWNTPLAQVAVCSHRVARCSGYLWRHYRKRRERELRYSRELERHGARPHA